MWGLGFGVVRLNVWRSILVYHPNVYNVVKFIPTQIRLLILYISNIKDEMTIVKDKLKGSESGDQFG